MPIESRGFAEFQLKLDQYAESGLYSDVAQAHVRAITDVQQMLQRVGYPRLFYRLENGTKQYANEGRLVNVSKPRFLSSGVDSKFYFNYYLRFYATGATQKTIVAKRRNAAKNTGKTSWVQKSTHYGPRPVAANVYGQYDNVMELYTDKMKQYMRGV